MAEKERGQRDLDEDIPEPPPRDASLPRPVLGTGTAMEGGVAQPIDQDVGLGPGEIVLERERKATRARPRR